MYLYIGSLVRVKDWVIIENYDIKKASFYMKVQPNQSSTVAIAHVMHIILFSAVDVGIVNCMLI